MLVVISTLFVMCCCSVFVYCTKRQNATIININIINIIHTECFIFVLFSNRLLIHILLIITKRLEFGIPVFVFVLVVSFFVIVASCKQDHSQRFISAAFSSFCPSFSWWSSRG